MEFSNLFHHNFVRIYGIHLLIGSRAFPILFVYSESRTKAMYKTVFEYMRYTTNVDVSVFMSDYEQASRCSIKEVFPSVTLCGCWFHFINSLFKRIRKLGLQKYYSRSQEFNSIFRQYISLCFVPIEEVRDFQGIIKEQIDKIEDNEIKTVLEAFYNYFCDCWIDGKYSISDWNQLSDITIRSNNWTESYHAFFGRRFNKSHPNIMVALESLSNVASDILLSYNDYLLHQSHSISSESNRFTLELISIINKNDTIYTNEQKNIYLLFRISN